MSDYITPETFNHLVKLAELEMDAEEAEYLRGELNKQLNAIKELEAIPIDDDVPLSLHGVPYSLANSQAYREDVWKPFENVAGIISQVPEVIDDHVIVPDIPHKTLE
ncbi:MAG: aspartyl/glutamyl-tRNA amidotransferase subunit C [Anaerolineaceae bacterium]|nr:aspartyl/glutamyl-tRNA amidotransferase subunit C [Anaerolineaceae bacterium]